MKELFAEFKDNTILIKTVRFFYENPACVDTADNIAGWIGEKKKSVKKILDFLVKHNVLNKDAAYVTEGYSFTQDKNLLLKIGNFLKDSENV